MPDLTGRLHLAESGDTCAVTLAWDEASRTLGITGQDVDVQVPAKSLSVSTDGGANAAVHLVWQSGGRTWAVTLTDRDTIRALAGVFAASLAHQLDSAILENLHATRLSRLTLAMLALLVLAGLCCAWLYRGTIADFILRRRSPAIERQLGRSTRPECSRSCRLVVERPGANSWALRLFL